MTKDSEMREKDVPVEVSGNCRIIAEGVIESSAVHISLIIASVVSFLVAVLVLPHVRFSIFAAFCLLAFLFATAGLLIGVGANNERIIVTETSVLVKNIFGKELYLCTDSITAVGISAFNTVHVLSDACKMKCMFVKNGREIVFAIRTLIGDVTDIV